ncbi:MAB_1171c family putative transporter [Streptomyces sp. NPDC057367]|uniref:MAB_1171c family putative transporter n=1 Tax=Streptomyces sp. NPDC057367 TaxID=3346108 RepID=UPI0036323F74
MSLSSLHIPYALPAVLLILALSLKTPTFVRAWKDPDVRATSLLLLLASAVFLSVAPASIHKINTVTGVPNIAAPWVYSLLTAFCGSCLTMVITWRDEPSPRRRARIRRIWLIYTGIVVALWATYLLADVPAERIYDLDTYYATEPWMREHILLYLAAHMVSALVAAYMIWKWISKVTDAWLKAGLVFLQAGYAFGLVFDVAKLAAVGARWAGVNWDWLSTRLAPPFAILDASLVGIGFILPQGGPFLQKWIRDQRTYRRLRPLARAIRRVAPSAARARVGRFAPLDLRLLQRQQRIHDGLLRLAPHVDAELLRCAFDEARAAGHRDERARGIAGAIAVRAALEAFLTPAADADDDRAASSARIDSRLDDIEAIARAFRQPRTVDAIRQRVVTTESVDAHA